MFWYFYCHHPKLLPFIIWNQIMTCVNANHILGRFQDDETWEPCIFDMCAVVLLLVVESEGEFLRIYYLSLYYGFACIVMMKHEYTCYLLYRVEENNTFSGDKVWSKLRIVRCGTHAWKCMLASKVVPGASIATEDCLVQF